MIIDSSVVLSRRKQCSVCNGSLDVAIDLPHLPLTDTYCREPIENPLRGIDQKLLFCENCGHGQLEAQIAPQVLYGSNYCFRTSASVTARKGTQFFLSVLDQIARGRKFKSVLDLGCNDLHLLSQLKGLADIRIGIDPVWKGKESEREDQTIILHGENIEDIDLSKLPTKSDLIVCRHTLEHISDPRTILNMLVDASAPDALFIFEVPRFDSLIARSRFDQVFHQHLQYFSLASFIRLFESVGGHVLLHRDNYHDWGAMAVAFERSGRATSQNIQRPKMETIRGQYKLFKEQMAATSGTLEALNGSKIYGYGAAQMLPVLAYHMNTDFSQLAAILDDDSAKDGIGYWNLPVKVFPSAQIRDLSESSVLITAVDNVQPIMTKLLANRPRHIIYPFHIL